MKNRSRGGRVPGARIARSTSAVWTGSLAWGLFTLSPWLVSPWPAAMCPPASAAAAETAVTPAPPEPARVPSEPLPEPTPAARPNTAETGGVNSAEVDPPAVETPAVETPAAPTPAHGVSEAASSSVPPSQRRERREIELMAEFDRDQNGVLNAVERTAARARLGELRTAGDEPPGRRGPGGRGHEPATPGPSVKLEDAPRFPHATLYDPQVIRTFFLTFEGADWEAELADFYRTDVTIPAHLTVDGKLYADIGVSFRGNSSFFTVGAGSKRSLNLVFDAQRSDQNLYGYRTTNLLNAHTDPSFLRNVLYSQIARNYIPAPRANFVHLVVNGESWGLYVNEQQFNKEFTQEWFGSRGGARWKVPAGGDGRALNYLGPDPQSYVGYELKSDDQDAAWQDLMDLCRQLAETPTEELDTQLNDVLNVDRTLWFLALDNVLLDVDGYYTRGSDYAIYQDPKFRRFHLLPYDNNETFRTGQDVPFNLDPFTGADQAARPLLSRLLSNPRLRARYVAHVRTLAEQALDWETVAPRVAELRAQIEPLVQADTRKLSSYDAFVAALTGTPPAEPSPAEPSTAAASTAAASSGEASPGGATASDGHANGGTANGGTANGGTANGGTASGALASSAPAAGSHERRGRGRPAPPLPDFFQQRRAYLLAHPEISRPAPTITLVESLVLNHPERNTQPYVGDRVTIVASLSEEVPAEQVLLYFATHPLAQFDSVEMHPEVDPGAGGPATTFTAELPKFPAGTQIRYYVEARAAADLGTTRFSPEQAEMGAYKLSIEPITADSTLIRINEVMAGNKTTLRNPQGEYADWIELVNISEEVVDISGMYLTDSHLNLRKWEIPAGTKLNPHERLLIWADEGDSLPGEFHASFKLSQTEEMVLLVDREDQQNRILDRVSWVNLRADVAYGRAPDGEGEFHPLPATPGAPNPERP